MTPLTEYAPLVAFFLAYRSADLTFAIQVVVGVTLLAVAASLVAVRRLPVLSLLGAALVLAFGGLSLALGDDRVYKMKPTVLFGVFAVGLVVARAFRRYPLKTALEESWSLTDEGWHRLSLHYAAFFAAMAVANEVVWRTQTEAFWVNWKVFGGVGLTVAVTLSRLPFVRRHAPAS